MLAVVGTAVSWGIPSFRGFSLNARRTADINAFVLAVQLSRSEAAKRARPVVLCKTLDRRECIDDNAGFSHGWMVFVNSDDLRPPDRGESEELLLVHVPESSGPISANRDLFEFRPFGRRSTNGTVTFCDERGAGDARAVIISYTGRPRVASTGPGGRALGCGGPP